MASADAPGAFETTASLALPAGKFVVNVTAIANDDFPNGNDSVVVACSLDQTGFGTIGRSTVDIGSTTDTINNGPTGTIAIAAAPTLGAPGALDLDCASFGGHDHLESISMTAIKVDDINVQ